MLGIESAGEGILVNGIAGAVVIFEIVEEAGELAQWLSALADHLESQPHVAAHNSL